MIFQPEVEPANNIGARTMPFLSSCLAEAPLLGRLLYHTPFSDRTKNKARRGNPAGLGHTPEGYLFVHESRFTVQKSQVALRRCMAPAGVWLAPRRGQSGAVGVILSSSQTSGGDSPFVQRCTAGSATRAEREPGIVGAD
jgi:hypothetical protein